MIAQAEDREPHSTLEVADRHSIVGGLEPDHSREDDNDAPEVDEAAYAPQLAFDPEQKIPVNHSLPEVLKKSDDGLQAVDESGGGHRSHLFGLSRRTEISVLMLLLVAVFAAAGIGIGLGVTNAKPSRSQEIVLTLTSTYATSTSSPTSQPSVVSASSHLILNDSSLTALGIDAGDRTVIYQDQVGFVRQATYNATKNKWGMAPLPVVTSGPKNSTPLALMHNPSAENDTIHLFYIANSDNLAFVVYDTFNQSWSNHTELVDSGGLPFRAATKSRTLLAKRLGVSTPSLLKVLIHYENTDGNVTVLEGVNNPPSASWAMQDITSKLTSSIQPPGTLSVPCSSMRKGNAVRLIATEKTGANLSETATAVTANYEDGKFNTTSEENMFDPVLIGESDLQLASNDNASPVYGFWVKGTRLASFNTVHSSPNNHTMPDSSFPYARLAGINPIPGQVYYLYNHIGPDTLLENQWNLNSGSWTPREINITEI
ncbi:hypothetical protein MMC29_000604 [Sticta canariensis]|nr:hypothetical protein [Sticta canariensis]